MMRKVRLLISDVIVAALAWTIADWNPVEQLVAAVERLAKLHEVALPAQRDAKLPAHPAGSAIAANEIGGSGPFWFDHRIIGLGAHALRVLLEREEFAPKADVHAGSPSATDLRSGSRVYCEIS